MVRKPNLFIIGAAKCATSSLHTYLSGHPKIYMSYLKEPGFFAGDKDCSERLRPFTVSGKTTMLPYRNDLSSYLSLFDEAGEVDYLGESSTAYSQLPFRGGVPDRIFSFNNDSRIIYVLRDPVERSISHFWWNAQHEGEKRDLLTAIREDTYYRDLSYYAMQLKPYLDRFGSEKVFWLTSEALSSNPQQVLERLLLWLGLDESVPLSGLQSRENATPQVLVRPKSMTLQRIRFSRAWDYVGPWVPTKLRSVARRWTERKVDRTKVDNRPAIEFLRSHQRKQTDELIELLEYDFSEWKTLNGASS